MLGVTGSMADAGKVGARRLIGKLQVFGPPASQTSTRPLLDHAPPSTGLQQNAGKPIRCRWLLPMLVWLKGLTAARHVPFNDGI